VLLKDNRIVSRYLERVSSGSDDSSFKLNRVQLQATLGPELEITDFFFDQVLLILKVKDQVS